MFIQRKSFVCLLIFSVCALNGMQPGNSARNFPLMRGNSSSQNVFQQPSPRSAAPSAFGTSLRYTVPPGSQFMQINSHRPANRGEVVHFGTRNVGVNAGFSVSTHAVPQQRIAVCTQNPGFQQATLTSFTDAQNMTTKIATIGVAQLPTKILNKNQQFLCENLQAFDREVQGKRLSSEQSALISKELMPNRDVVQKIQYELARRNASLEQFKSTLASKTVGELKQLNTSLSAGIVSHRATYAQLKLERAQLAKSQVLERLAIKKQMLACETECEKLEGQQKLVWGELGLREWASYSQKNTLRELRKRVKASFAELSTGNQTQLFGNIRQTRWLMARDEFVARTYNKSVLESLQGNLTTQLQCRSGDPVINGRLTAIANTIQCDGMVKFASKKLTSKMVELFKQHGLDVVQYCNIIGNAYQIHETNRYINQIIHFGDILRNPVAANSERCANVAMRLTYEAIDLVGIGAYIEAQQITVVVDTLDRLANGKLTTGINIDGLSLPADSLHLTEHQRITFAEAVGLIREIQGQNLQKLAELQVQFRRTNVPWQKTLFDSIEQTLQHPEQLIVTQRTFSPEIRELIIKSGGNPVQFECALESPFETTLSEQCFNNIVCSASLCKMDGTTKLFLDTVTTASKASIEAVNQAKIGNYRQAVATIDTATNLDNLCSAVKQSGVYSARFAKGAVCENLWAKTFDYFIGKVVEASTRNLESCCQVRGSVFDNFMYHFSSAIAEDVAPSIESIYTSDKPLYVQMASKLGEVCDRVRIMSGPDWAEFAGQVVGTLMPGYVEKLAIAAADHAGVLPAIRYGSKAVGLDVLSKRVLHFIGFQFPEQATELVFVTAEGMEYRLSDLISKESIMERFESTELPAVAELVISGKTAAEIAQHADLPWKVVHGLDTDIKIMVEAVAKDAIALEKGISAEAGKAVAALDQRLQQLLGSSVEVGGKSITYREYFEILMRDAEHNFKITQCSIEEAIAGYSAEKQGFLKGPLSRDTSGGDLRDILGFSWDSKRAISRIHPGSPSIFNAKRYVQKMVFELKMGENIIIDATNLDSRDMVILIDEVSKQLTQKEVARIIIKTGLL